jgi:hypothetical protein
MKQTAVEWLVNQLNKQGFAQVVTDEEIQQAKEMEKEEAERMYSEEEILDAWELGAKEGLPLTKKKKEELFKKFKKKFG